MGGRHYIFIALCACLAAAAVARVRQFPRLHPISLRTTEKGAKVSPLARALRPNYPYSIIPGGAYSPAELRAAIDRDALVREHYRGFDLNKLKLVRLTEDHYSFVSFRKNNRFFWTSKRLKIPAGEILLTNGKNYAKTRCGNRLSETPMTNSAAPDVQDDVLSPPSIEAAQLAKLQFVSAPMTGEQHSEFAEAPEQPQPISSLLPAAAPSPLETAYAAAPSYAAFGGFGSAFESPSLEAGAGAFPGVGGAGISTFPFARGIFPETAAKPSTPVPEPPVGIALPVLSSLLLLFSSLRHHSWKLFGFTSTNTLKRTSVWVLSEIFGKLNVS